MIMDAIYHAGELAQQRDAGAEDVAAALGRTVLPFIGHLYVDFIHNQPFLIAGGCDSRDMVWASILGDRPGCLRVVDEQTLEISTLPHAQDPLRDTIRDGNHVGLLLIDQATRRRLRVNGRVVVVQEGFTVQIRQVYANCPRYIQARSLELVSPGSSVPHAAHRSTSLHGVQRDMIGRADTFFVGSYHAGAGADVSHRGGYPGFVQTLDAHTIVWPEYNGNGMFNTLGNLRVNPRCGLLFLDFETGTTLQLSGTAQIIQDGIRVAQFPGAERLVEFRIGEVVQTGNGTGLRWRFSDYSPDNPWYC